MPYDLTPIGLFRTLLYAVADHDLSPGLLCTFAPSGFPAMAQIPDCAPVPFGASLFRCIKHSGINGPVDGGIADL